METNETTLQVNKFARRSRHLKVFSRGNLVKIHALDLLKGVAIPFRKLRDLPFIAKIRRFFAMLKATIVDVLPVAPQKRLLFQSGFIAVSALLVTSLTAGGGTLAAASMTYSHDYISSYSLPGDILVTDEDGYLVKINPQTDDSNRIGMTDYAVHTVESGESLSVIAERYGVGVETIMWENSMYNPNSLRIGQKLLVPPVNGISYEVKSGDTLNKIADKYKITMDAIIAQNALESDVITKGQDLFLPGAAPIQPVYTASSDYRVSSGTRSVSYANVSASSSAPVYGKVFIFPTTGKITQGYRAGHYAIDISDTSKPPIWAAGTGTVTKASSGTWGGGYGNHIIVDHGGGLQTLYAHLDSLNVYEGQFVSQGDVIGIMGNTGRVYGITGIHLHWEVIQDGVKQYPGNFY